VSLPVVPMIEKRCECTNRGLPLRVQPEWLDWLRAHGIRPPTDIPVQTYRCHKCGETVTLTAGDLHFAA
jgi:hypothetical protein